MNTRNAVRIPRLPAAARKAGATEVRRGGGGRTFLIGFKLTTEGLDQPGNGPAVVAALKKWAGSDFTVEWAGTQGAAIILTASAPRSYATPFNS